MGIWSIPKKNGWMAKLYIIRHRYNWPAEERENIGHLLCEVSRLRTHYYMPFQLLSKYLRTCVGCPRFLPIGMGTKSDFAQQPASFKNVFFILNTSNTWVLGINFSFNRKYHYFAFFFSCLTPII